MMSVILCDYNTAAFLLWRKYDCTRYWSKRKRTWTDRRLCQISNIKYLFAVTFLSFLIQSEHLRLLRKSEVLFRSRCTFDSNDLTWLPTSYSLYRDTMISRLIPLLVGLTGTRDWMLFRHLQSLHNFQIFTHTIRAGGRTTLYSKKGDELRSYSTVLYRILVLFLLMCFLLSHVICHAS